MASRSRAVASVRTSAIPMPKKSEKKMRPIMSPSAAALMGFMGTMPTRLNEPAPGLMAVPFRARSSSAGEAPRPGPITSTRTSPMTTAMAETTTV